MHQKGEFEFCALAQNVVGKTVFLFYELYQLTISGRPEAKKYSHLPERRIEDHCCTFVGCNYILPFVTLLSINSQGRLSIREEKQGGDF